jgi:competence protein ComEC
VITPLALLFAVLPWPPLLHFDHWLLSGLMAFSNGWRSGRSGSSRRRRWRRRCWRARGDLAAAAARFPGTLAGLCLLLPALLWPAARPAAGDAWVDVLDVGQGLAVVVRTAEHTLLYDTGPLYSAESDAGQRIIVPYLRAQA